MTEMYVRGKKKKIEVSVSICQLKSYFTRNNIYIQPMMRFLKG